MRIVTEEEFPHGLRCSVCSVEILPGEPYGGSQQAGASGGIPIFELVCAIHEGVSVPASEYPESMVQAMDDAAVLSGMEER